jgi:hypothetical protein
MALAREHHARVLVLDGDGDVRERLVVAQPDVERRPVALDQVLLEVESFDLAGRDDHVHVVDPGHELPHSVAQVTPALEVAAHPRAQRLRLPHVEH